MAIGIQNGAAVNMSFPGGIAITAPGGSLTTNIILQSAKHSVHGERVMVHDEVGNRVVSDWLDPYEKATLEMVLKGTGVGNVQAVVMPLIAAIIPGIFLNVTACTAMPDLVGTTWEVVDGPEWGGSNKDAKKWTVNLERAAGITAAVVP